jgi:transcription elongation factor
MDHPFVGDLSNLSMEELTEKINTLGKALSFAARSGKYQLADQVQLALNSYRAELGRQQRRLIEDGDAVTGVININ